MRIFPGDMKGILSGSRQGMPIQFASKYHKNQTKGLGDRLNNGKTSKSESLT